MKPTALGIISILFGLGIVGLAAVAGGNLILMGLGLFFVMLGGLTKKKEPAFICPHCRSQIDPLASICPHCRQALGPQPAR
ncbi:MAG TPA: hypothetical protein PK435_13330 [Thermoanaerobaculaceae bacterium]|nr:hypothetical protein [Thermoanaerobaculaceae bacterium]